jgi:hypothetical protein
MLNFDVWSLACIMTEVLVFICGDRKKEKVIDFYQSRRNEHPSFTFYGIDGVKQCVTDALNAAKLSVIPSSPIEVYLDGIIKLLFADVPEGPKWTGLSLAQSAKILQNVRRRMMMRRGKVTHTQAPEEARRAYGRIGGGWLERRIIVRIGRKVFSLLVSTTDIT